MVVSKFGVANIRLCVLLIVISMLVLGLVVCLALSSIAALLGGLSVDEGLAVAQDKFRSISFVALRPRDFVANREKQGKANTLFRKTEPTKLGQCDVFLSHSWSDDGGEKFMALAAWAEKFRKKNNRQPKIWLDKACIDQSNIEQVERSMLRHTTIHPSKRRDNFSWAQKSLIRTKATS